MTVPTNKATNEQDELRDYFISNYGESRPEFEKDLDELLAHHTQEAVARAEAKASIDGAKRFWIWFQPIMVDIWNGDITDPADIDKKVAKYRAELSAPQQSKGDGDENSL